MDLEHRYGDGITILDDPYLLTLLAAFGSPETSTARAPTLIRSIYQRLGAEVFAREFPTVRDAVKTRMAASEPRAIWSGKRLCRNTKLVVCAVVRAGIQPAQTCYELACDALEPGQARLDFINMSRTVDDTGKVSGVQLDGTKIGGSVEDAVVLVPDPMGATGSTIARVCEIYRELPGGPPRSIIGLHMMVTPEAIKRLQGSDAALRVYSARLDRGLSPADVLETAPGTHHDRERGLNEVQYIVPGAGGVGELLTNSWV